MICLAKSVRLREIECFGAESRSAPLAMVKPQGLQLFRPPGLAWDACDLNTCLSRQMLRCRFNRRICEAFGTGFEF